MVDQIGYGRTQELLRFADEYAAARTARGVGGLLRKFENTSLTPQEGRALYDLILKFRPATTIEVGLAYGVSALYAVAARLVVGLSSPHIVIDPFQVCGEWESAGLIALNESGIAEQIHFIEDESQVVLPQLLRKGSRFDFAFVDGAHYFDRVFLDLWYMNRLAPGGLVLVDDVDMESVACATNYFVTHLGWAGKAVLQEKLPGGTGPNGRRSVLFRVPEEPVELTDADFVPFWLPPAF
jgi:predicted O-methyltransferase YrrM